MIQIFNQDCFETMASIDRNSIDVVLTSPPYNTNKKAGKSNVITGKNSQWVRYDMHVDNFTDDEYCSFTRKLFLAFDGVLKKDGVVLYNISYGNENPTGMFQAINAVVNETPFTIADVIVWKKKSAFPNNQSHNKLTRIFEFVFVMCRKDEYASFYSNKKQVSIRPNGQVMYGNIMNFIEAPNNDEVCPYNKATYSSELCEQLLNIYAPRGGCVYDPFMGSGTTAIACQRMGLSCIGSEISAKQCEWAEQRLSGVYGEAIATGQKSLFDALS